MEGLNGVVERVFSGRVVYRGPKSFKVEGRSNLLYFSQWAEIAAVPEVGQMVRVRVDKRGFVRQLDLLEGGEKGNGLVRSSEQIACDLEKIAGEVRKGNGDAGRW